MLTDLDLWMHDPSTPSFLKDPVMGSGRGLGPTQPETPHSLRFHRRQDTGLSIRAHANHGGYHSHQSPASRSAASSARIYDHACDRVIARLDAAFSEMSIRMTWLPKRLQFLRKQSFPKLPNTNEHQRCAFLISITLTVHSTPDCLGKHCRNVE